MVAANHSVLPLNWSKNLHYQSVFLSVSQLKNCNSNLYYWLLLLRSGNISLRPRPSYNLQQLDHDEWDIFKHKGLYFLKLNINSLFRRIGELLAKLTNTAVIGISESELDNCMLTSNQWVWPPSLWQKQTWRRGSLLYKKWC